MHVRSPKIIQIVGPIPTKVLIKTITTKLSSIAIKYSLKYSQQIILKEIWKIKE